MVLSGRAVAGLLGVVALVAGARPAAAQVTQTDAAHTPLPQPVGLPELELINDSWGWNADSQVTRDAAGTLLIPPGRYGDYYPQFVTGDAITLNGLFKWRKESIDPVQDAETGPGSFPVGCGFTGQMLLMGGNCQMKLGWYNVLDPASTTPPSVNEIFPFVDAPIDSLHCTQEDGLTPKTDGFCPLAWDNVGPRALNSVRWLPATFSTGELSKDSRYTGGSIGFALIGAVAGKCTQTKFSVYEHNQRNAQGVPWVTTLIYHSSIDPTGYYLAFEDLPMPAADWTGALGADGDFNDQVFYVSSRCSSAGGHGGGGSSGLGAAGDAGAFAGGAAGAADGGAGNGAADDNSAGESDVAGGGNAAGKASGGGASAQGGTSATGGTDATSPSTPSTSSSSCGCAVPGRAGSRRALPLLALLLGAAFARRRRRAA